MSSFLLAYVAGVVTILSPCVLPLLPIVLGGAVSQHKFGPLALAAGLVLSFTIVGLLLATVGVVVGLTPERLTQFAAAVMIVFGIVLLSAPLQERFAVAAATATGSIATRVSGYSGDGLSGQFILGALLGAVWTPCVGPTLGAAIALAAQGQSIAYAATIMFSFALGTVTPLLVLMIGTREAVMRNRSAMLQTGAWLKTILGGLLILVGFLFLTGLMTEWEAFVLDQMPDWLIKFIYGF